MNVKLTQQCLLIGVDEETHQESRTEDCHSALITSRESPTFAHFCLAMREALIPLPGRHIIS